MGLLRMEIKHVNCKTSVLWFNLVRVEICELRPKVVTEDKGVLVHYQKVEPM